MNKQTFAFAGVFIPANIWTNPQMSWLDRLVWAVVEHHHDGSALCVETDAEIATLLNENEMLVTASVSRLMDLGFVNIGTSLDGTRELWTSHIRFVEKESQTIEAQASMSDVQRIVDLYNECCKSMPRAEKLTPPRVRRIRALLKDNDESFFKLLFLKASNSSFISGKSGKWLGANIDWILYEKNMVKINEGVYDDVRHTARPFVPENLRGE